MRYTTLKDIQNDRKKFGPILKRIQGLARPSKSLKESLDSLSHLNEKGKADLEELMGIFTAWQNFFSEELAIIDTMKTIASSQEQFVWSETIELMTGTNITERREKAKNNKEYQKSLDLLIQAKNIYTTLESQFWNCDRAYKLVSRILTSRLSTQFGDT